MVPVTLRPRSLIMENRVSSTNELKYRFSGKTRDENFEVTYTLQERVSAAAWALAYQNCRLSSEKFQNTFDKPAPDFKTIFAWRQRLLYNGCLVDKHFYVEDDPPHKTYESSNKNDKDFISFNVNSHNAANMFPERLNRRKRLRYYKNIPPRDTTDSSTSESEELPRKSRRSLPMFTKKVIVLSEEKQKVKTPSNEQIVLSDDSPEENVDRFMVTKNPQYTAVNSRNISKNLEVTHDESTEDNNISVTPDLTVLRSDLANFAKSPVRVEIPESQFSEDIYFDDDIPLAAKSNKDEIKLVAQEVEHFLMPNVPPQKKSPQKPTDPLLNVLEDIVSESDRYSSDGNASETDSYEKMYGKDDTVEKPSPQVPEPYTAPKEIPKYQPSYTAESDFTNLPLPKFAHKEKVKILNDEPCNNSSNNVQPCTRNMSVAMRRIYESMASNGNNAERIDELVLEYIPTKINPAMAKRNHQFFNDDVTDEVILECNAQSVQISKMPSPIKATVSPQKPDIFDIIKKIDSPKKPVFKLPLFEDYLPEEDDLYKDSSSDGGASDRTMLRTPPAAPNIGPMVTETADEPQRVQDHMTENMTTITKVMCQPNATEFSDFIAKPPPEVVTQVPVVFNDPPSSVAVTKPTVIFNTPPVADTNPTVAANKTRISPTKPMYAVTKSPVAATKPTFAVTKSPVVLPKPPIVVNNSPVTVTKPIAGVSNPPEVFTEPQVTVSKPPDAYNISPDAYKKLPDVYKKLPDVYNKSPDAYNKSPNAYNKSPNTYNKSPGAYKKSPDAYTKSPDTYNKLPGAYNKLPDTINISPDAYNKSSDVYPKAPDAYTKLPDAYTKLPNTYNKSPGAYNKLSDSHNKSPGCYNLPDTNTKAPDSHNKSPDISNKLPDISNKSAGAYTKSPKSPDTCNISPDAYNKPAAINYPPAVFALPPIDFSKPPPPMVQKEPPNIPPSICNFNFANINANDIIRALQNIQNLSTADADVNPEKVADDKQQNEIAEEGDLQIVEDKQQDVIDCDVEEIVKIPASIPFLSDMFDPGSPVHEDTSPKDPEVIPDFNFKVPSDNYLDLPLEKPIVGSFKSFAFAPKPIMLNRLRKINEQKLGKSQCDETNHDDKKGTKRKKVGLFLFSTLR